MPKGSVFKWFKTNIYYHTVFVGQEFRGDLAGCFWFRVCSETEAKLLVWAIVIRRQD